MRAYLVVFSLLITSAGCVALQPIPQPASDSTSPPVSSPAQVVSASPSPNALQSASPTLGQGFEPIDPTATFTRVQNEVFTPTCAAIGCHDTLGKQSGLDLSMGHAYADIVNVKSTENKELLLVDPRPTGPWVLPTNSYLYRKLTGEGISGDRMPLGGPNLTDAELKLVRDWIRRGAPND